MKDVSITITQQELGWRFLVMAWDDCGMCRDANGTAPSAAQAFDAAMDVIEEWARGLTNKAVRV